MILEVSVNTQSNLEGAAIQNSLNIIANTLTKENLAYIADLCKKPQVNEKFNRLKNNPIVKSLL